MIGRARTTLRALGRLCKKYRYSGHTSLRRGRDARARGQEDSMNRRQGCSSGWGDDLTSREPQNLRSRRVAGRIEQPHGSEPVALPRGDAENVPRLG